MPKKSTFVSDSLSRLRRQQFAYVVLCASSALLLVMRGPASLLSRDPLAILLAFVAVFCYMRLRSLSARVGRMAAGASAEKDVAKVLSRAGIRHVLHSVDLSAGGDADHVLLGPVCAVVETKYAKGEVKTVSGGLSASGRKLPRNPVSQVRRQAAALRKVSGVWTEAIVCVTGMTNKPFKENDVTICSLGDLYAVISSLPKTLSTPDADRVAARLDVPNLKR